MTNQPYSNPSFDAVDEAIDESFPASDPPAHGGATHAPVEAVEDAPAQSRRMWPWLAGAAAFVVVVCAIAWRMRS